MNRELKRGPGGFITRSQWVLSGYIPGREGTINQAYFNQYLWDFDPPVEEGGFHETDVMRHQMEDSAAKMVADLEEKIDAALKSRKDFRIGETIHVDFHRTESGGPVRGVAVYKGAMPPIVIEDDFSENWEPGEVGERVKDAMMLVAARDPNAESAEEEPLELTPGELLGHQLHMVSTRNMQLYQNMRLGVTIAETLGLGITVRVIAAMEKAQAYIDGGPISMPDPPPRPAESVQDADGLAGPTLDDLLACALSQIMPDVTPERAKRFMEIIGEETSQKLVATIEEHLAAQV